MLRKIVEMLQPAYEKNTMEKYFESMKLEELVEDKYA